jgi:hypothetical protein
MVEQLEARQLLAATPVVLIGIAGSSGQISGVVLTFGVALDAASAQNVEAYSITKRVSGDDSSFAGIDTSSGGGTRRVTFRSAVYDPAARSVTLTPTEPFDLARRFRRLRVSGVGANAVKEVSGTPIDGNGDGRAGGDAVVYSRVLRVSRFVFKEADGDTARLRLSGPGKLRVWSDRRRNIPPVVFLFGTDASRSSLTGSVVRHRRTGDGVVTIHQITGTSSASVPLLADPAFRVNGVNP